MTESSSDKKMTMQKLLRGTVALGAVALGTTAYAAEFPARVYKAAPAVVAPVHNWTGFYAGVTAGYGWSHRAASLSAAPGFCDPTILACTVVPGGAASATAGAVPGLFDISSRGALFGGEIGYNLQVNRIVLGVAADFSWANLKGSDTRTSVAPLPGFPGVVFIGSAMAEKHLDTFGTVRARLGYTPVDPLLIYLTGGLAYGHVSSTANVTEVVTGVPLVPIFNTAAGSVSRSRVGATIGGGGEWRFAPNWTLKAEYLRYDLGSVSYNLSTLAGVTPGRGLCCTAGVAATTDFRGSIVRVGLNYKFGWDAPAVVTRY